MPHMYLFESVTKKLHVEIQLRFSRGHFILPIDDMDTSKLITAPSLYEALSTNIRCTQKGQYELILPASFCFGPS